MWKTTPEFISGKRYYEIYNLINNINGNLRI